jgi:hypothetical protein
VTRHYCYESSLKDVQDHQYIRDHLKIQDHPYIRDHPKIQDDQNMQDNQLRLQFFPAKEFRRHLYHGDLRCRPAAHIPQGSALHSIGPGVLGPGKKEVSGCLRISKRKGKEVKIQCISRISLVLFFLLPSCLFQQSLRRLLPPAARQAAEVAAEAG